MTNLTLPAAPVRDILERAFAEDAPSGDITSQLLIPADARATLGRRVRSVTSAVPDCLAWLDVVSILSGASDHSILRLHGPEPSP